jgi:hypothetical protein
LACSLSSTPSGGTSGNTLSAWRDGITPTSAAVAQKSPSSNQSPNNKPSSSPRKGLPLLICKQERRFIAGDSFSTEPCPNATTYLSVFFGVNAPEKFTIPLRAQTALMELPKNGGFDHPALVDLSFPRSNRGLRCKLCERTSCQTKR